MNRSITQMMKDLKMKNKGYLLVILTLAVVASCRKPYLPPVVDSPNSYLVVEGVINAGSDTTFIKLSRTIKLADSVGSKIETGAQVSVEADGFSKALTEKSGGTYYVNGLNLDDSRKYHIKITTRDNLVYESDPTEVRITPPIDDITFKANTDNVQLMVSAHDATNNTRYYRYDYDEDWRFRSRYESQYKVVNNQLVARTPADDIFNCFAAAKSNNIVLVSTSKLAQDIVSNQVVSTIPSGSERISIRYSMLLKQYAITKEAYDFWENLKKNTEQLGSVFDALPSQLVGNIHNVSNPSEPVIGYISASTVQTKRIYINKEQLPAAFKTQYPYTCANDSSKLVGQGGLDEVAGNIINGIYLPTSPILGARGAVIGYLRSSRICVDCTLRGVKKPPVFWTDK